MFWSMCRTRLPQEIIGDFDDFLETTEIPRMEPSKELGTTGVYTISDTQDYHTFYGVKMPPPCGYFGVNYSR